jgi:hypothetical protein
MQQQHMQQQQMQQGFPGAQGYPPPAQQSQPYNAYPETHQSLPQVQTYQGHVEGLRGWNDPPPPKASEEDPILKTSEHPENMIVTSVTGALDVVKASPVSVFPLIRHQ